MFMNEIPDRISGLDKLDYRRIIQDLLADCLYAKGRAGYGDCVNRLILSLETEFPNMDFATPIKQKKDEELDKYYAKLDELKKNRAVWFHPLKHGICEYDYAEDYYDAMLEFVRDLLAKHRGLLFGSRQIEGGTPLDEG